MPWPIPTAKAIAESMASTLEAAIVRIKPLIDLAALSRAVRSEKGMFAQIIRAVSLEVREAHDHIGYWSRQYFADTAEEEMVLRHAAMWGVDQRQATRAIGTVLIEGEAGTALPALLELTASTSIRYRTTGTATIAGGGSVSVPVEAVAAGSAGNLESGIRLTTVTPFPEISRVTVEAPGVQGGADEESWEELQQAVLTRIRQPPHGGAGFDYVFWVSRQFATKAVAVVPEWIGRGSVGVIVAMKADDGSARVPTDEEVDAILDYLGPQSSQTGVKPTTAHLVVLACELQTIPISVRVRPDTVATRAAVTEAYRRYIETIGDEEDTMNASPIGARIEPSRISEAISAASGEYAHDLDVPAAPYTLAAREYPVFAAPTFLEAT
jgi:uncharacterized phage protein gp47/JayE